MVVAQTAARIAVIAAVECLAAERGARFVEFILDLDASAFVERASGRSTSPSRAHCAWSAAGSVAPRDAYRACEALRGLCLGMAPTVRDPHVRPRRHPLDRRRRAAASAIPRVLQRRTRPTNPVPRNLRRSRRTLSRHGIPDDLPASGTVALFARAVSDSLGNRADPADVFERTLCLMCALYGLTILRTNKPSFPWPPLEALEALEALVARAVFASTASTLVGGSPSRRARPEVNRSHVRPHATAPDPRAPCSYDGTAYIGSWPSPRLRCVHSGRGTRAPS